MPRGRPKRTPPRLLPVAPAAPRWPRQQPAAGAVRLQAGAQPVAAVAVQRQALRGPGRAPAQRGAEGLDENNIHHFHHALTAQLFNLTQLPTELLLEYDQNIVRHTQRLNERRITRGEEPIVWKYFQYLTLLFTEIYLDRYFRDPKALLSRR